MVDVTLIFRMKLLCALINSTQLLEAENLKDMLLPPIHQMQLKK